MVSHGVSLVEDSEVATCDSLCKAVRTMVGLAWKAQNAETNRSCEGQAHLKLIWQVLQCCWACGPQLQPVKVLSHFARFVSRLEDLKVYQFRLRMQCALRSPCKTCPFLTARSLVTRKPRPKSMKSLNSQAQKCLHKGRILHIDAMQDLRVLQDSCHHELLTGKPP